MEENEKRQYVCPKCGCQSYEHDQFQATGGNFARLFDVQNKHFITVSCTACGYTELYRAENSQGMDVLDFLLGG
jgi:predicted nucleic-acid-binding Zn-ribbon protein